MPRFKVVITDPFYSGDEVERQVFDKIDAQVCIFNCKNADQVIEVARDADALLVDYVPITKKVIRNLKKVRVVVRYVVGYDNIDVEAATKKGIYVCNVPDFMTYEVADHTIGLILALVRKIPWAYLSTKAGEWCLDKFKPIHNIESRTVGVIGFGRIGREVAAKLRAFKPNILVYDPYVPPSEVQKLGVQSVDLMTLLKRSDILTIHAPLTKETRYMIGEKELRMMKKSAILVNTARGAIIDQKALYTALKEKWISAAGIDVLEKEPPDPDDPLIKLENVIITPHMASYTDEAFANLRRLAAETVIKVLMGQKPKNMVNPEILKNIESGGF